MPISVPKNPSCHDNQFSTLAYQKTANKNRWGAHAVDGVSTYQVSHTDDNIAGLENVDGASFMKQTSKSGGHSIGSFLDDIKYLPEGTYRYINGRFIKEK